MHNNYDCRLIEKHEKDLFVRAVHACYIEDVGLQNPDEIRDELDYRQSLLEDEDHHHFVLLDGDQPIGISATWLNEDGNIGYGGLRIIKAYQKQGLGKLLYNIPMQHARETYPAAQMISLKVAFDNADSIHLAEKRGFKPVIGEIQDERITYHRPLGMDLT